VKNHQFFRKTTSRCYQSKTINSRIKVRSSESKLLEATATLTADRNSQANKAYSFDINQHIDIPVSVGNYRPISISLWFQNTSVQNANGTLPNPAGTIQRLIAFGTSANQRYSINYNINGSKKLDFRLEGTGGIGGGGSATLTPNIPINNVWHHVVVTVEPLPGFNSRALFYVDDSLIAFNTYSIVPLTATIASIGRYPGVSSNFKGVIDDISVFNRVLSPAEITSIYTGTSPVSLPIPPACTANGSSTSQTGCDVITLNGKTYNQSGTYRDTLVNVGGCDSVVIYNLTVKRSSSANLNISKCFGESYFIGGQSYARDGVYQAILINAAGCDSVVDFTLTFAPDIVPTMVRVGNTLQAGPASLLQNATGFQWLTCFQNNINIPNQTASTYIITQDGYYKVEVAVGSCKGRSGCENYLLAGIDNTEKINANIFPNPVTDVLTVSFEKPTSIELYDVIGKKILSTKELKTHAIEMSSFDSGIYILKTMDGKTTTIIKQ
jgi:hypothetical protein